MKKISIFITKLKALIAAGLIGTAGLGMQSCNMAPEEKSKNVKRRYDSGYLGLQLWGGLDLSKGEVSEIIV